MGEEGVAGVYRSMIDAAAGEGSFTDVLTNLERLNSSPGAVLFELNRRTGQIITIVSPQLEFGEGGYNERINAINPRMRYSMRHAPGHITYDGRFTTENGMARHEFYDWLMQDKGLKYFMGVRLFDEGDISVFHSVEFSKADEHPDQHKIDRFAQTSRRLANAWRLWRHHQATETVAPSGHWTPDYLPWGIIALAGDGQVRQMNRQASRMIEEGDVIHAGPETLEASAASGRAAFRRMLLEAVNGGNGRMCLTSVATRSVYVAQCIPVEHKPGPSRHDVASLLYLWNPLRRRQAGTEALAQLWALSPAEAKVASQIARGRSLNEVADILEISRNTARNHLQQVFQKTGTSRQAELSLLLFGVLDYPASDAP